MYLHAISVCVRMHTFVCCLVGGSKKIAFIVISFLENVGQAGNRRCPIARLARTGVQVLKVVAGSVIVTLATRCCVAKVKLH